MNLTNVLPGVGVVVELHHLATGDVEQVEVVLLVAILILSEDDALAITGPGHAGLQRIGRFAVSELLERAGLEV